MTPHKERIARVIKSFLDENKIMKIFMLLNAEAVTYYISIKGGVVGHNEVGFDIQIVSDKATNEINKYSYIDVLDRQYLLIYNKIGETDSVKNILKDGEKIKKKIMMKPTLQ